jgi:hypothetical protein
MLFGNTSALDDVASDREYNMREFLNALDQLMGAFAKRRVGDTEEQREHHDLQDPPRSERRQDLWMWPNPDELNRCLYVGFLRRSRREVLAMRLSLFDPELPLSVSAGCK